MSRFFQHIQVAAPSVVTLRTNKAQLEIIITQKGAPTQHLSIVIDRVIKLNLEE